MYATGTEPGAESCLVCVSPAHQLHNFDLSRATATVMAAATNTHAAAEHHGSRAETSPLQHCTKQCSIAQSVTSTAAQHALACLDLQQLQHNVTTQNYQQYVSLLLNTFHPSSFVLASRRNKEALYKFSTVFQQDAGQDDVYEGTTASLVCTPASLFMGSGLFRSWTQFCELEHLSPAASLWLQEEQQQQEHTTQTPPASGSECCAAYA
jgi:hypothetical protein